MREREWLTCTEPEDLLRFLDGKLSVRQLTLVACACCKHVWDGFPDPRSRTAVVCAEEFADGQRTLEEMRSTHRAAAAAEAEARGSDEQRIAAFFQEDDEAEWGASDFESEIVVWFAQAAADTVFAACPELVETVNVGSYDFADRATEKWSPCQEAMRAVTQVASSRAKLVAAIARDMGQNRRENGDIDDLGEEAQEAERAWQCELVRHIAGDPFRQKPRLPYIPTLVRELAAAVYAEDRLAVGPLHDALLEAGLERLAAHFRNGREWHPRGCWALDLLLARK